MREERFKTKYDEEENLDKDENIENENNNKENKKRGGKMKLFLIIFLIFLVISVVYVRFIATSGFIVKEYKINSENIPSSFDGFKIVHLSDIHYATVGKEKLDSVVDEINKIRPDVVVFTGDLHDRFTNLTDEMREKIIESMKKIEASYGKFAVSGNHDYEYDGYKDLIIECGFTYLENESKLIYFKGNTPIEIVGYPSLMKAEPNFDIPLTDNYKIALIHEGDAFDNIKDKGFDLVLAGHSHNGQVRLPFIGAIYTPEGSKKYYDEHYTVGKSEIYVNSGLGSTEYNVRAFNKPSFNLYRFYTK